MDKSFIIIYGYGYSGSGAVLDLLKEFDCIDINKSFFTAVKSPYGLIELENALTENWEQIKAANAIRDYLWLCKKIARPSNNYCSPAGLNLTNTLNKHFYQYSKDFISELVDFEYFNWNEITDFRMSYFINIFNRFRRILARRNIVTQPKKDLMPFCCTTHEFFQTAVRKYVNKLFEHYYNDRFILIDHHPLPIQYGEYLEPYFGEKAKMIVVDRDPRSIYFDLVKHKNRIGLELARNHDPYMYIKWHRALRKKLPQSPKILYLTFEDLISDYDAKEKQIIDFLGITEDHHINKKKFFDPSKSIRNTNIWETEDIGIPRTVFDTIYRELIQLN